MSLPLVGRMSEDRSIFKDPDCLEMNPNHGFRRSLTTALFFEIERDCSLSRGLHGRDTLADRSEDIRGRGSLDGLATDHSSLMTPIF